MDRPFRNMVLAFGTVLAFGMALAFAFWNGARFWIVLRNGACFQKQCPLSEWRSLLERCSLSEKCSLLEATGCGQRQCGHARRGPWRRRRRRQRRGSITLASSLTLAKSSAAPRSFNGGGSSTPLYDCTSPPDGRRQVQRHATQHHATLAAIAQTARASADRALHGDGPPSTQQARFWCYLDGTGEQRTSEREHTRG